MTHMLPEDLQRNNELRFSRKHINGYIREAIEAKPEYHQMVQEGAERLRRWLDGEYHESKKKRLAQLATLDIQSLVCDLLVGSAYFQYPDTFVSASAMLAKHLDFDDRRDAILTVAELCAVLCWTGAFTLWKETPESSMMFRSNLEFPQDLVECINRSQYLPPMVCAPKPVSNNFESPYLTHNDCRILGKGNGHMGDLCLDVLNIQTQVPLKLDTEFLSTVEEEPTFTLDTPMKLREWNRFKVDSYNTYLMLVQQGNQFWLDQKPDKRGRIYAQGYHVTTQGSAFKKAMLEFANEEVVEGVPDVKDR